MKHNNTLSRNIKLAKSFLDPLQVSYLILYVTNRCNFGCNFCFYHSEIKKGFRPDELRLDEFNKISQKAGPIIQLSITGGEPFIRHDLADVTGLFVENNIAPYITVPTNASLPDRIVAYLEKVLPKYPVTYFRIVFSIDGVEEEHDKFRSQPGSYKKIMESYAAVSPLRKKYHNLVLDSNSMYTAKSEPSILNTVQAIRRLFSFDNISVTYVRGDVKDPEIKKISNEKYTEVNDYLQSLEKTKEKRFLYPLWRAVRDISRDYLMRVMFKNEFITPCVGGRKLLIVAENGEVYPCELLRKGMGNVRDFDYDLKTLLSQSRNRELVKWIRDSKCKCTFECALAANVLWGRSSFFRILRSSLNNIGKG